MSAVASMIAGCVAGTNAESRCAGGVSCLYHARTAGREDGVGLSHDHRWSVLELGTSIQLIMFSGAPAATAAS